jgi:HPt (histidine-containing phosphotransfer) domain-containing protein
MAEGDVIDRTTLEGLLESVGGDVEFLSELLETFFDDAPVQIAAMQSALAAGQAEDLRRAAHSMKSNSASFGALALSRICKELEESGKAGLLEGVGVRLTQMAAEYEKARLALEAVRGGM